MSGWRCSWRTPKASGGPGPDLELAELAWRWLEETELLAPDLDAVPGGGALPGEEGGAEGVDARAGGSGCRSGIWRSICSEGRSPACLE
ncbi:hypothetical protein SALBM135S_00336 [Streptomyces alboniger]